MKYSIGDRFLLAGVECFVGFINSKGYAYLFPENDGDVYNNKTTLKGWSMAIVNDKGRDKLGNKVLNIVKHECGAV